MGKKKSVSNSMLARLRVYFFAGVLVTAPLGVTAMLAWWFISYVDSAIIPLLPEAYRPGAVTNELFGVQLTIPGAGLIFVVIMLTLIGWFTAGLLGRWVVGVGESLLNRMPIVRNLYGAIKQILETVLKKQSDAFKQAVMIEYPRRGLWAVAFVTANTHGEMERKLNGEYVNVFLPTTPNPTSGFLLLVPKNEIVPLDMSVEDAVKMVISAGIVIPDDEQRSGAEEPLAGGMSRAELDEHLAGDEISTPGSGES